MPHLSNDAKRFIVEALACHDSPQQVADAVNQEFGIRVTRQQVERYDPTKQAGIGLSNKWRTIFDATRSEFGRQAAEVRIFHKMARLRVLDRLARKADISGNVPLLLRTLEQAAKEVGGWYEDARGAGFNAGGGDRAAPRRVERMQ